MRAGLRQEELAERAGTTTRTLGSIERGDVVGQTAVIERLIDALDLVAEPTTYDPEVEVLIAMIGELLQQVPPQHRPTVAREIVLLLTTALGAGPVDDNVTILRPGMQSVPPIPADVAAYDEDHPSAYDLQVAEQDAAAEDEDR